MKDLNIENYWWRKLKIQINGKLSHVHWLEDLILLFHNTESDLQIQSEICHFPSCSVSQPQPNAGFPVWASSHSQVNPKPASLLIHIPRGCTWVYIKRLTICLFECQHSLLSLCTLKRGRQKVGSFTITCCPVPLSISLLGIKTSKEVSVERTWPLKPWVGIPVIITSCATFSKLLYFSALPRLWNPASQDIVSI